MNVEDVASVANEFKEPVKNLDGIELLYARYEKSDYECNAFVLFQKDGELYEVRASHCGCSCMGLEGQWIPSRTTVAALRMRLMLCEDWPGIEDVLARLEASENSRATRAAVFSRARRAGVTSMSTEERDIAMRAEFSERIRIELARLTELKLIRENLAATQERLLTENQELTRLRALLASGKCVDLARVTDGELANTLVLDGPFLMRVAIVSRVRAWLIDKVGVKA